MELSRPPGALCRRREGLLWWDEALMRLSGLLSPDPLSRLWEQQQQQARREAVTEAFEGLPRRLRLDR